MHNQRKLSQSNKKINIQPFLWMHIKGILCTEVLDEVNIQRTIQNKTVSLCLILLVLKERWDFVRVRRWIPWKKFSKVKLDLCSKSSFDYCWFMTKSEEEKGTLNKAILQCRTNSVVNWSEMNLQKPNEE